MPRRRNIDRRIAMSGVQVLQIMRKLDKIEAKLDRNFLMEIRMATELDDLEAKLAANTNAGDAMMALLDTIKAQLDAAGTDPARLSALSAKLADNSDRWTAATLKDTPAAAQAPVVSPPVGEQPAG